MLGEDEGAPRGAVREPALRAAGAAAVVLERTGNMSVTVIVGQIRSTAVDILRSSGMSYREAADAVRGRRARRRRRGRDERLSGAAGRGAVGARPQPGWQAGHQ